MHSLNQDTSELTLPDDAQRQARPLGANVDCTLALLKDYGKPIVTHQLLDPLNLYRFSPRNLIPQTLHSIKGSMSTVESHVTEPLNVHSRDRYANHSSRDCGEAPDGYECLGTTLRAKEGHRLKTRTAVDLTTWLFRSESRGQARAGSPAGVHDHHQLVPLRAVPDRQLDLPQGGLPQRCPTAETSRKPQLSQAFHRS